MSEKENPKQALTVDWASRHLKRLQAQGFFGSITIEFKSGEVVLIRQEQTLKPPTSRQ